MSWMPEAEWRQLHKTWHQSPEARALKDRLRIKQKNLCARCGPKFLNVYNPWDLELNLTRYHRPDAFGRDQSVFKIGVRDEDANLLCPRCHKKGTYSWDKMKSDKQTDGMMNAFDWPFEKFGWLCKKAWRGILWAVSRLRRHRD